MLNSIFRCNFNGFNIFIDQKASYNSKTQRTRQICKIEQNDFIK